MNKATRERFKKERVETLEDWKAYAKILEELLDKSNIEKELLEEKLKCIPRAIGRPGLSSEVKELIRRDRRLGVSLYSIAKEYSCSVATVHNIVKDLDIDLRKRSK